MKEGKEIIDIGPDEARRQAGVPASPYYEMERKEILNRDYPFYRWEPQP
jgi:hypothetical protein